MSSTREKVSSGIGPAGEPKSDLRQLPDGSWVQVITCHGPIPGLEAPHYAFQGTYTTPLTWMVATGTDADLHLDDFSIPA